MWLSRYQCSRRPGAIAPLALLVIALLASGTGVAGAHTREPARAHERTQRAKRAQAKRHR